MITAVACIRFNVTTCLYLSLKSRARSLSTLIAVIVKNDTEPKRYPAMKAEVNAWGQMSHRLVTTEIKYVAYRGSEKRPTKKSVVARLQYKIFDGG